MDNFYEEKKKIEFWKSLKFHTDSRVKLSVEPGKSHWRFWSASDGFLNYLKIIQVRKSKIFSLFMSGSLSFFHPQTFRPPQILCWEIIFKIFLFKTFWSKLRPKSFSEEIVMYKKIFYKKRKKITIFTSDLHVD